MWLDKRPQHLSDQDLLDWYLAARGPEEGQDRRPGALPAHVNACPSCARRYAALVRDLDVLADDGASEADATFTPERLDAQRQQIVQRLEQQGRRADVFLFPARGTAPVVSRATSMRPARWVAAAAIAGLAAGLAVGLALDGFDFNAAWRRSAASLPRPAESRSASSASSALFEQALPSEAELLDSIELALTTRRVPVLRIYDELTPERIAFTPGLR
jgi:hypothetical protein